MGKEGKATGKTIGGIKMKLLRLSFLAVMAAVAVMGLTGSAFAFHDGGVARCEGCHTMHNSLRGAKMSVTGTELVGNNFLLIGSDPSSTCLSCHGTGTVLDSYHVDTDAAGYTGNGSLPAQRTPGGDFAWLKVSFNNASSAAGNADTYSATADESKNRHGHHIVVSDYNFLASTDYASIGNVAPGGTYPVGQLSCIGCHDPHNGTARADLTAGLPISGSGSYGGTPEAGTTLGVYRLLGGIGYIDPNAGYTYTNANAPVAVAPSIYNAVPTSISDVRVAYGSGMSEWCGNCHAGILNNQLDAGVTHTHVAGSAAILNQTLADGVNPATTYQGYVNSGTTSGGSGVYWTLVPYEEGATATEANLLADAGNVSSATSAQGGNVMCLSCHRAHASGFSSMARFDLDNSFVTDPTGVYAYSGADNEMHPDTSGYYAAAYYNIPNTTFSASQRALCDKCHAKD
jgi:hypothetical protein